MHISHKKTSKSDKGLKQSIIAATLDNLTMQKHRKKILNLKFDKNKGDFDGNKGDFDGNKGDYDENKGEFRRE